MDNNEKNIKNKNRRPLTSNKDIVYNLIAVENKFKFRKWIEDSKGASHEDFATSKSAFDALSQEMKTAVDVLSQKKEELAERRKAFLFLEAQQEDLLEEVEEAKSSLDAKAEVSYEEIASSIPVESLSWEDKIQMKLKFFIWSGS